MSPKPTITHATSSREIERLTNAAEVARRAGDVDGAIDAWHAVLAHPCARHRVAQDEILDEIHQLQRQAGRYEEAISAKRQAIAAGYRSVPDPEADIAECLVLAGRREEADRLYAELRERDVDDVWLNNSAAYAYAGIDDREALRWSLDGIDRAIATGDEDRVIGQLVACAEASWAALGEVADQDVLDRAAAFQRSWTRPPWKNRFPHVERRQEPPCPHCGWDPATAHGHSGLIEPAFAAELPAASIVRTERRPTRAVAVAIAWFPDDAWDEAVRRWPHLLDDLPAEHLAYSHEIEARTKRLAKQLPGQALSVSPMTVEGLVDYALGAGDDPGSAGARSSYAAELLRVGAAIRWPPGRNDRCWCGSGAKYKQCCGPIPPLPVGR